MFKSDVIIIGGGPAGLAAAGKLATAGIASMIVEQHSALGGAIHRQPVGNANAIKISSAASRRWKSLMQGVLSPLVATSLSTTFFGIDGDGIVLVQKRDDQSVEKLEAKAVVVATGAVERVRPLPGWESPGVSTAGGIQVMMKETGLPPKGRVLLAGNGPLLVALAAQMIRAGNPPVAVIEAGDPLRKPFAGLNLFRQPALFGEALGYTATLLKSSTQWLRNAYVERIEKNTNGLLVHVVRPDGSQEILQVDRIALHDGIMENDIGLPEPASDRGSLVLRAGDCRQALGVLAAVADGEHAASVVAEHLGMPISSTQTTQKRLASVTLAQKSVQRLFKPTKALPRPSAVPDETVLCRCEGRTVGELKKLMLQPEISGREVKHNGRFAMGSCQGRFCAANTAALMADLRPDEQQPTKQDLTGQRWPVRPISIGALASAASLETTKEQEVR